MKFSVPPTRLQCFHCNKVFEVVTTTYSGCTTCGLWTYTCSYNCGFTTDSQTSLYKHDLLANHPSPSATRGPRVYSLEEVLVMRTQLAIAQEDRRQYDALWSTKVKKWFRKFLNALPIHRKTYEDER